MKLKYILTSLIAVVALATSCEKEVDHYLSEVQVSTSYVAIPQNGGSQTVSLTATDSWNITDAPEWLSISPASGVAGTASVVFSAESALDGRTGEVHINCGGKVQNINVIQGLAVISPATCAEVIAGPDSKSYKVTGTCTAIANTQYGNFYIDDGTGSVYIYGTVDASGSYNWSKFNIEVGDIVTVQGPKTTYNGTVELVDAEFISVQKSLVKCFDEVINAPKEGGEFDIRVICKGNGLDVTTSADWIHMKSMKAVKDTTFITFFIHENVEDSRVGSISFSSSASGQTSTVSASVNQATGLSMYTLPYAENFAEGFGAFEIVVDTPRADGKDIWSTGVYNNVAYAKASAGAKGDTKSMLVSPKISMAGATSPVLTFKHCGKYFGNQQEESTLWVSTDGCVTWTQLLIPEHDNAYGWKESGDISLARFASAEYINIAFQYVSTPDFYGTWEIADVKVEDRAPVFTSIAQLDNAATSAKVPYEVTLTDAVVKYVNGGNAFIEDATGGVQLYLNNHGLTAGQKINGKVNITITLYSAYAEATGFDCSAATVTEDGDTTPTVLTLDKLLKSYLRYQNCMVKLENVTFDTAITPSNRNGVVSQDGQTIAAYAQVKNTLDMSGTGNLVCFPTRYNANLQLGVFDNAHFTK